MKEPPVGLEKVLKALVQITNRVWMLDLNLPYEDGAYTLRSGDLRVICAGGKFRLYSVAEGSELTPMTEEFADEVGFAYAARDKIPVEAEPFFSRPQLVVLAALLVFILVLAVWSALK